MPPSYLLFLIIALLTLNTNWETEKRLEQMTFFLQSTQNALRAMRTGLETFHASFLQIAPPPANTNPSTNQGNKTNR